MSDPNLYFAMLIAAILTLIVVFWWGGEAGRRVYDRDLKRLRHELDCVRAQRDAAEERRAPHPALKMTVAPTPGSREALQPHAPEPAGPPFLSVMVPDDVGRVVGDKFPELFDSVEAGVFVDGRHIVGGYVLRIKVGPSHSAHVKAMSASFAMKRILDVEDGDRKVAAAAVAPFLRDAMIALDVRHRNSVREREQ